jgi:hypothetical protein
MLKIDKRKRFYKKFGGYKTNDYVGAIVMGLLAGLILAITLYNATHASPKAPQSTQPTVQSIVAVVEAHELPCDYDPMTYIRCSGEKLGKTNEQIMTLIRIMKCESNGRVDALNKNTNGTFDVGVLQINDVHNKRISRADRMDFVKNIDFGWKLHTEQKGFHAWSCYKKVK